MIELVIGGAASGKSEYAEKRCVEISSGKPMVYLATMISGDKESDARIDAHRERRRDMGFSTVEQSRDVGEVSINEPDTTVLLECVTNLLANEMFSDANISCDFGSKILEDIAKLYDNENVENLVIVTGNVFEDGMDYEGETVSYIETLANINTGLAARADRTTEVVCGISLMH